MASVGAKRKRSYIPPPVELGAFKCHPKHTKYVGWSDGTIWSTKSGKFIRGAKNYGYSWLNLRDCGNRLQVSKHRFNFEIVHQRTISDGMDIDHINGDKKDDRWSNLQELTRVEHNAKTSASNPQIGHKSAQALGQKVIAVDMHTGEEFSFISQTDAARELGLLQASVNMCLKGRTTRAGRFKFKIDPMYLAEQADLQGEEWRQIGEDRALSYGIKGVALENIQVSNMGRIQDKMGRRSFGHRTGTFSDEPANCYMGVQCGKLRVGVHVLCALAFVGPRPSALHTVDHIDRQKSNNHRDNLRWCTRLEQGQNQSHNRAVLQVDMNTGSILNTYSTIAAAARALSLRPDKICKAASGAQYQTGGYRWRYVLGK